MPSEKLKRKAIPSGMKEKRTNKRPRNETAHKPDKTKHERPTEDKTKKYHAKEGSACETEGMEERKTHKTEIKRIKKTHFAPKEKRNRCTIWGSERKRNRKKNWKNKN